MESLPKIIQGGMGVGVSNWKLAKSVSIHNCLGVVSGTALDTVLVRRLQDGDKEGDVRRAMKNFPDQSFVERILNEYFLPEGRDKNASYKLLPMHSVPLSTFLQELNILSSFVEVFLAKENHNGKIGINLLEKVQIPNLSLLYGAMLAGVDYVIMGAGIPREIPYALDKLSKHEKTALKFITVSKSSQDWSIEFDPQEFQLISKEKKLMRPKFLAIISSDTLANHLVKKSNGSIDGFIIENFLAGGHNAPPRGQMSLNDEGEPLYTIRDMANLEEIKKLNKPFWLAGNYCSKEKLVEAVELGAVGVQIGSAFAFCEESGVSQDIKTKVIEKWGRETFVNGEKVENEKNIFTDPYASPTGYPFKVAPIAGSLSENKVFDMRKKICDIGLLRSCSIDDNGMLSYHCSACHTSDCNENSGRKCLCNGLLATIGIGQIQKHGYVEPPLITAGESIKSLYRIVHPLKKSYSAKEVISSLH